jgi:hypothetical protein
MGCLRRPYLVEFSSDLSGYINHLRIWTITDIQEPATEIFTVSATHCGLIKILKIMCSNDIRIFKTAKDEIVVFFSTHLETF